MAYLLKPFVALMMCVWLSACTGFEAKEFEEKWEQKHRHTFTAWWYVGEDETHVYLVEDDWPLKKNYYRVPKVQATVVNIAPFSVGTEVEPVSINESNVVIFAD